MERLPLESLKFNSNIKQVIIEWSGKFYNCNIYEVHSDYQKDGSVWSVADKMKSEKSGKCGQYLS
jgi:hypothetical protein